MSNIHYKHLLSPLEAGDVLLKSRMTSASATPHFIQGTEPYPTEKWITLMANRARAGASAISINHVETGSPAQGDIDFTPEHFSIMAWDNTSTHNYLCQMIDAIRYYGSVAMYPLGTNMLKKDAAPFTPPSGGPGGPGGPGGSPGGAPGGPGGPGGAPGGAPGGPGGPGGAPGGPGGPGGGPPRPDYNDPKAMQEFLDDVTASALFFKKLGFQMLTTRLTQGNKTNIDFCVSLADALKQTLGKGYPIEFYTDGVEAGGTVAQNIELARALEGHVDILTVRYGIQDWTHPTGFTSTRENPSPCIDLAEALTQDAHARGAKLKIGVSAGLHDPDFCENLLAKEKADLVVMARTWICDPEYGIKLSEGRGEDVVPCVRCNKCHVPNDTDKFRSFCTVNPRLGMEEKVDRMIAPVTGKKKVAVVGGGPGGLYAAMTLADRGHDVTLYEKDKALGGQLIYADYPSFKWPLADYKNWLIKQVYKRGVEVKLGVEATTELLKAENYDAVIVSVGAVFSKLDLPGADGPNVLRAIDVYGKLEGLPNKVVVIGGSETGVETGMYMAENGHDVTVMCRKNQLAYDAAHAHYRAMVEEAWLKLKGFHEITSVQKYIAIEPNGVRYIDANGSEAFVEAELVILNSGAKPNTAAAAALYGAAPQTYYVGDCRQVGNVHFAITSGYGAANQI